MSVSWSRLAPRLTMARIVSPLAVALLQACGGGAGDAPLPPAAATVQPTAEVATPSPARATALSAQGSGYKPLKWSHPEPATTYTLPDGTLVTQVGGRVRNRHAREIWGPNEDSYDLFSPNYFVRRTHDMTIYDNVSPTNASERIVTVVVRPQWWLYGTNFRAGYIGRNDNDPFLPVSVALYGDNGGMKRLPAFSLMPGQELKTPVANYNTLPSDPASNDDNINLNVPPAPGEFVLVKQLTYNAAQRRNYREGDLLEFELGLFLAGPQGDALGRFNYYAEPIVYRVGSPGARAWYRGPCCDTAIPWDSKLLPNEARAGGDTTLHEDTSFQPQFNLMQAATNIAGVNIQPFVEGRRLFHTSFIDGSHSEARNNPNLAQAGKAGPKFQQAACIACHAGNGKSSPLTDAPLSNMGVLTADLDPKGKPVPDARFGGHLAQGLVVSNGNTVDGRQAVLKISGYKSTEGRYPDGTTYSLKTPQYVLTSLTGQTLPLPERMSVRAAPHLIGMGLLEAVPESTLQALADASVNDKDGAVGRLQIVPDKIDPTIKRVGRFGWKATSATVEQQTAEALNADMGVTTAMLPRHLCGLAVSGTDCRAADSHGPEVANSDLTLLTKYLSLLGVPPQRHFDGEQPLGISGTAITEQPREVTDKQIADEQALQARVLKGGRLFDSARCNACHVASLTTGKAHGLAELRKQTIRPYTDLLLHDMGPDLADQFPQGEASGKEWRTAPLWGLGLLASINPNVRYLHDGRARTVEEAILWHGGQGAASRDRFKAMSAKERADLIQFVNSR
ncbi:di-heme oxidoredictase family protein [Ideonella sp. DXS29W]|uniref:Di-heme oxidoredictase family protein n=1 Tax=Ideonella lacteola TaxID=2984193 RepID=A0ABU9BJ06_9BURK